MESSTFSHLPPSSLVIKKTSKVIIRDCIFLRMYPSSITVSQTKRVEVVHNELSLNAIKAVSTSDGSHLFISCNRWSVSSLLCRKSSYSVPTRLLGDPVAPECLPTTTTTSSTTTTTEVVADMMAETSSSPSSAVLSHLQTSQQEAGVTVETLVGVVTGALVILSVLVVIILALLVRKHNYLAKCSRSQDYILHSEGPVQASSIPAPHPLPVSPLYTPDLAKISRLGGERLVVTGPVWLDEIQNNPIFNRQRHKLTEEEEEETRPLRSISGN